MTSSPHDELFWQAFRYVAGEMPEAERQAFEQKLEEQQSAREAVAAAVELSAGVLMAASPVERRQPLPVSDPLSLAWNAPARWSVLAAAAGLLLMLGLTAWFFGPTGTTNLAHWDRQGQGGPTASGQLAVTWSQSLELSDELVSGTAEGADSRWSLEAAHPLTERTAAIDSIEEALEDPQMTAPEWMLAAVSGLQAERSSPPETAEETSGAGAPLQQGS